jgi:hypothetical protein
MSRAFKVRFHLGLGDNFMKWRVENMNTNEVQFFDPQVYSIKMNDCKLHNQRGSAEKIFDGGYKTVCAWIMASRIQLLIGDSGDNIPVSKRLMYNPRVTPNWTDSKNTNIDKKEFKSLVTCGKKLFING